MATTRLKPMTGFITLIMPSSCSAVTIFEKTVEKDIPSSIKFSTGVGSIPLMANPMPAESSSITSMTARALFRFLVCWSSFPVMKPVTIPISTGRNTRNSTTGTGMPAVERWAETKATTRKNTSAPTRSSRAAMGISVLVTGPAVLNSLTTDNEGAGAVARAMPPKRKAR